MAVAIAEFFQQFMPHGHCYYWRPEILWLHVGSDALITVSYFSIPLALVAFARRRDDLRLGWILYMFAAFIVLCGTTHVLDIVTTWNGAYGAEGLVKFATGIVSAITAVSLWRMIPAALMVPSRAMLEEANEALADEVKRRVSAEQDLRSLNSTLEARVADRTRALDAQRDRVQRIIEYSPLANLLVDADGRIAMVNAHAELTFGYTRQQLMGQSVEMLVPASVRGLHPEMRQRFFAGPEARPMGFGRDLRAVRWDGTEFPVEIGLNPIETEDGLHVLVSIIDITERVDSVENLRDYAMRLEEANRELDRSNKELVEQEEKLRRIIEYSPDAKILTESRGRIAMVNAQAERMFGYERSELLGQSVDVLVPDSVRERHPGLRREFLSDPQPRPMGFGRDLRARRRDGSEFPVEIGLNPIDVAEVPSVLVSIIDITDRVEAVENLRRNAVRLEGANRDLERSNRDLADFAHVVSHDLKAPLRGISYLAGWMKEDLAAELGSEGIKRMEELEGRVRRLSSMIDGILTYSRVGHVAIRPVLLDTRELVDEIVAALSPPRDLEITVSPDLPQVRYDRTQLAQVFQNLIGNSIQHMHGPNGRIEIGCVREGADLRFSVSDNGPGIEEQYSERIFKMFQTLAPKNDQETTGIGLAVVKRIVERHGGAVGVRSRLGEGAEFWFTVPVTS